MEGAWSLLDTWFRKDTNSVPNVYVLQPISSVLAHYADMVSEYLLLAASPSIFTRPRAGTVLHGVTLYGEGLPVGLFVCPESDIIRCGTIVVFAL